MMTQRDIDLFLPVLFSFWDIEQVRRQKELLPGDYELIPRDDDPNCLSFWLIDESVIRVFGLNSDSSSWERVRLLYKIEKEKRLC